MGKKYVGIDPGQRGYMTIERANGHYDFYSFQDNDLYKIGDVLAELAKSDEEYMVIMEEIHALFGSSAKATFSFGEIYGTLKGLLIANKIPYSLVPPSKWQKKIWINSDVEYIHKIVCGKPKKTINTKKTSINAAKRLFPSIDLRRNERCKNIDDNKVDSLLIMEYGRRNNF